MKRAVSRAIRIGMLGAGVVGQGVLELLRENAESIEQRLGAPIEVRGIAVRDVSKARSRDVPAERVVLDPARVVDDPEVDLVVEVMGGLEPARSLVRRALDQGKPVVTANKALLAEHGHELVDLAEARGVDLTFEAAVAGGVPVIRVLREAMASDRVVALRGIVNGTSNYILSRMNEAKLDFPVALQEAQASGYAEADPTLDIGGGDAAHKLVILATLAFGAKLGPEQVATEGIDRVGAIDMEMAARFGYVIKPLAIGRRLADGVLDLRVHPALVPASSVLASISGALNAVTIEGAALGPCLLSGYGAGARPTAMSVVSDIIDVGRNLLVGASNRVPQRALRGEHLVDGTVRDIGQHRGRYYLRFVVRDRPGMLARIGGVLGAFDVSIHHMVQEGRAGEDDEPVQVVMVTHEALDANIQSAIREIHLLSGIVSPTTVLRIEEA